MTLTEPHPTHTADASELAAGLAARIPIPTRLPDRADGRPIGHLSASSYAKWVSCPEAWRRYYIQGEQPPTSGAMFIGSRVDDALSAYYRQLLEHHEHLTPDQVLDLYAERWREGLAEERDGRGIHFDADLPEAAAFQLGARAVQMALARLIPELGEPTAVQRRIEMSLAPGLAWSIIGFLDLETTHSAADGGEIRRVVDFKVRGALSWQDAADRDPQASLYLAARWLEGDPAAEFRFAQIAKPGPRRREMSAGIITTTRTVAQHRGILARLALAASQIAACHERFGPAQPWGFADPTTWRCSRKYCDAWATCPGGGGIG